MKYLKDMTDDQAICIAKMAILHSTFDHLVSRNFGTIMVGCHNHSKQVLYRFEINHLLNVMVWSEGIISNKGFDIMVPQEQYMIQLRLRNWGFMPSSTL